MTQRIFYIFHGRYPSEKAAALFAAKSCEAFGALEVPLTLLVPRRLGRGGVSPHTYFRIDRNFSTIFLPTIDVFEVPYVKRVAFYVTYVTFSLVSLAYLLLYARKDDYVYSNESLPLFLASYFFPNTLYEVHDFPEKKIGFYRRLLQRMKLVLVTNEWKAGELLKKFSLDKEQVFCERNAVDIREFTLALSKEEARVKLKLAPEVPIILYTGHLYSWKGAHVLAEAGRHLEGVLICFVGGTEKDVMLFRNLYSMIPVLQFFGHQPHEEIPIWQKAADILILPNTAKEEISRLYTSPMKLFEYMASERPIIASDIPSVRDVVDDSEVYFVESDNALALAKKIKTVLREHRKAEEVSKRAREKVLRYTWQARAKRIVERMRGNPSETV